MQIILTAVHPLFVVNHVASVLLHHGDVSWGPQLFQPNSQAWVCTSTNADVKTESAISMIVADVAETRPRMKLVARAMVASAITEAGSTGTVPESLKTMSLPLSREP